MSRQIYTIKNANVYIDGNNMVGKVDEITLPPIKQKMEEHRALGMIGTVSVPAGYETMVGQLKFNSLDFDAAKIMANPFKTVLLECRSSINVYESGEWKENVPLVTFLRVKFSTYDLGKFRAQENASFDIEFHCSSLKQILDGRDVVDFDPWNNVFKIDGVDQIADLNADMGTG